jgi:hypothetical protein
MIKFLSNVVDVAQLARASDCGSEGRGFKSHHPPHQFDCEALGYPGSIALHALWVMLYFVAGMKRAPVAQLDRAMDFESIGRRFEPCRARHFCLPECNRCISGIGIDAPVVA